MTKFLPVVLLCWLPSLLPAQPFKQATADAWVVTRMVNKFHCQPAPLNDSFSVQVFQNFFTLADPYKTWFTQADISQLAPYKTTLHLQIQQRKADFLTAATAIYQQRLHQADSLITLICRKPFAFTQPEKLVKAEMEQFVAGPAQMHDRLYKTLKKLVLDEVLDGSDDLPTMSPLQLKKYTDSIEPIARKKAGGMLSRMVRQALEGPGGVQQHIATSYCNAIAQAYDPHTEFMPATEKENFEAALGNKRMVFGFNMDENDAGDPVIDELMPGSPAFKSGQFNKGDKIIGVQWAGKEKIDVSDASMQELFGILDASNHDELVFTVKKPDGTTRLVPLTKAATDDADEEDRVKSFVLKGDKLIGYISLPSFYEDWEENGNGQKGCANDVAKEVVKLKKENIDGLILDLRYNGGGSLSEAVDLSGIFIDGGPVEMIKTRSDKLITLKDGNRGTMYDGPLMVLVNGYSASASEMVAGTLQDYNRAIIAGAPTYGKATAQAVYPMDTTLTNDDDPSAKTAASYIKITTARLYRINGTTAQATGVQPDVLLPDLLQLEGEREADNSGVIVAPPVEGNKYYKPYAALPMAPAIAGTKSFMQGSTYFTKLQAYIAQRTNQKAQKEWSLVLADHISQLKARNEVDSLVAQKATPVFTVQVTRTPATGSVVATPSASEKSWADLLANDPYVQAGYRALTSTLP